MRASRPPSRSLLGCHVDARRRAPCAARIAAGVTIAGLSSPLGSCRTAVHPTGSPETGVVAGVEVGVEVGVELAVAGGGGGGTVGVVAGVVTATAATPEHRPPRHGPAA